MRRQGQVAIETVAVIGLWILIIFFFMNIMFLLSSAILAQTGVNRLAVQVGSLGCSPDRVSLLNYAEEEIGGIGTEVLSVDIYTWRAEDSLVYTDVEQETDIDPETGRPAEGSAATALAACSGGEGQKPRLGDYIYVGVRYEQKIALPSLMGIEVGDKTEVYRSATTTSSRIEGGDL